ncbi:hypothetical protein DFH94DRAFT_780661 [Russula ochroleuca]|uniref:Uncharacterized protein n=1 Tax=Russula ochroleuca TaxID=152965 RepID=A0A9P5JX37_9AGAM|nr:hypothetical protein DFH94DRAFT_780661 [Russula ochroleuca]
MRLLAELLEALLPLLSPLSSFFSGAAIAALKNLLSLTPIGWSGMPITPTSRVWRSLRSAIRLQRGLSQLSNIRNRLTNQV